MLNLLSTLLLVPLFLHHWSLLVYGQWIALSSLTSYLGTLDLGMNSAVNNRLLASYVRKDHDEYIQYQHSAIVFYFAIALGGTLLMAVAAWLLPLSSWVGIKPAAVPQASWIIWLLSLQVLWMMPVGLLGNFYLTVGNPAKTKWLNNARLAGTLLVTIVALSFGSDMKTLAAWLIFPILASCVYSLWDIHHAYPDLMPGIQGASGPIIRRLLKPSLLFALITLSLSLTQQGSVLIVSSVLGTIAVGIFNTTRQLTNAVMQVVAMLSYTAWPDMTMLYAEGDFRRLRLLSRLMVNFSMMLCIALAAALWFEGPSVLAVWTGNKIHVDVVFFRLLLLYLVLQSPWKANSSVTAAVNRHEKQSWSYLVAGVLAVIGMVVLTPRLGLRAIPISLIFGEAVACYHFVIKDTCTVIGETYWPYMLRVWSGLAAVFGSALAAGYLVHRVVGGPALVQWAAVGAATLVVSCLMARLVWVGDDEWTLLCQKTEGIRRRLRGQRVPTAA
jgi:O-antigen/teichoic acid export membrane protein